MILLEAVRQSRVHYFTLVDGPLLSSDHPHASRAIIGRIFAAIYTKNADGDWTVAPAGAGNVKEKVSDGRPRLKPDGTHLRASRGERNHKNRDSDLYRESHTQIGAA